MRSVIHPPLFSVLGIGLVALSACGAEEMLATSVSEVVPPTASGVYRGDMNEDGVVNEVDVDPSGLSDIDAFVKGLMDASDYTAMYGEPPGFRGDTDDDGDFDFDDIPGFIRLLRPEPASALQVLFTDPSTGFLGADAIAMTADGRHVVFQPLPNGAREFVVHDTFSDTRFAVRAPAALGFNGDYHGQIEISDDGRYFVAEGTVGGPNEPRPYRTYRYDLVTGEARFIDDGAPGILTAYPSTNGDGQRVTFRTLAATGSAVWLADLASATTTRLVDLHPDVRPFHYIRPQISADGRYVLIPYYQAQPGDSLLESVLAIYDTAAPPGTEITVVPDSALPRRAQLSRDGRSVAFNHTIDRITKVYDRSTGTTTVIGAPYQNPQNGAISGDGRFVVMGNYIHDRTTGETSGIENAPPLEDAAISTDGRYVAFRYVDDDPVEGTRFLGRHAPNPLHPSQRPPVDGDYSGNGIVDAGDYTVWRDTYGSTTDLRADGNGNGRVDGGDYLVWQQNYGRFASPLGPRPEFVQYQGYGEATDTRRRRVVAFAGLQRSGLPSPTQTWEFNGATWIDVTPATSPSARGGFAIGYHPTIQRVVMFGGARGPYLMDTWTWDGTTWTELTPTTTPPGRLGGSFDYDDTLGALVLTGGDCGLNACDDWAFDGTDWAPVP